MTTTCIHPTDFEASAAVPVRVDLALVMPPGALRDATLYALRELKARVVLDHDDPSIWSRLPEAIERSGVDVLLFDVSSLSEATLTNAIGAIKLRVPHLRIIAAYPYDDAAKILMAMRAGAHEFVHSPVGPALTAAFSRVGRSSAPSAAHRGKVIGFVSAKGGCGATTVACHIAVDLKRRTHKNVLLTEFDSAGPLNFLMKTWGPYSLGDAFDSADRLDSKLWSALLASSRTGVYVLPAPAQLVPGDSRIEQVQSIIGFMRTQHDWAVVDFGRGLNPLLAAVARELDELYVVTTLDIPSLHMAKSLLLSLPVAYRNVPVRLVLNRTHKALDVPVDEIRKILGVRVHAVLPDDFAALDLAYTNGRLLGPDSALGKSVERMTIQLAGEKEQPKRKKFRFW